MFSKNVWISLAIFLLTACGGGGEDGASGGGTLSADIPTSMSWLEPQQNTDMSELTDLASYRFYYGSSPTTLNAVPALDLPVNSANPGPGATVTHVFTESDIDILTPLVASNTTHYYSVISINGQGVESPISEVVQYFP